ncbi:MAG: ABC transporter permease [Microbacterium sp.]|uniref:ABC transporter permease n=1 Tax=Microbacterium sp. TaxID=51671 RepID=UPI0039E4E9DB
MSTSSRRWRAAFSEVWPPLLTFAVVIAAWQIAVPLLNVPPYLLPTPSQIVQNLVARFGSYVADTAVTVWEILLTFGVSVVIGVPLGALTYQSRMFRRAVYPLLVASQTFPKLAIGPLFIIWFGFGQFPIILVGVLLTFFAITSTTLVGMREVTPDSIDLARIMGLNGWQRFTRIEVPQALPSIFGGLRLGTTLAVIGVVVAEFLGTNAGLGYRIINATATANTVSLFTCLLLLVIVGLVFYGAVALVEWLCLPWRRSQNLPLEQIASTTP